MRLFAALGPSPAALDHLDNALTLAWPRPEGRTTPWTPRSNWHVTLAFYGEVADQSADWLAGQAAQAVAGHSPFELHLSGAGQFPSGQSWIGLGGQTDRLLALMADCRALWPASADPVQVARPHLTVSRPHLTVSRRRRDRVLADALRALAVYRGPTWTVERARLFQSELGQGPGHHPLYTPLADLPLAAVPSA